MTSQTKYCRYCRSPKLVSRGDGTFKNRCRVCQRKIEKARLQGLDPLTYVTGDDVDTVKSQSAQAEQERVITTKPLKVKKPEKQVPPETTFSSVLPAGQTYVISYAQNATDIHEPFLESLLIFCREMHAELIVIPGRYKNPTSIYSQLMQHDEWWDPKLAPYLFNGREKLGNLIFYGDVSVQPTASRPLSGFEVFTGTSHGVFGHPRLQLKSIAGLKPGQARILTTTGAITIPNYVPAKAGAKGQAHHVIGALIVEVEQDGEDTITHLRQINAKEDGSFIDLDRSYDAAVSSKSTYAGPLEALICGDVHEAQSDNPVLDATFYAEDSLVKTLKPKGIAVHDLLSQIVRSHHLIYDTASRLKMAYNLINDSVEREVLNACDFLDSISVLTDEVLVVASNHNEHLKRYLETATPFENDLQNARFFHQVWLGILEEFEETGSLPDPFTWCYKEFGAGAGNVRFLKREDVVKIKDICVSMHSDIGPNGSRGSDEGLAKLGTKAVVGHGHNACTIDGLMRAGVKGSLRMGYNERGPSNWTQSDVAIYGNGKRSHIFFHHKSDGTVTWRLPRPPRN